MRFGLTSSAWSKQASRSFRTAKVYLGKGGYRRMVGHLPAHNSAGATSALWHQGREQPARPMHEAEPQSPTSSACWVSAECGWSKPRVDLRVAIIARRSEHYTMLVMSSGQIGMLGMDTTRPCTHSAGTNTTNGVYWWQCLRHFGPAWTCTSSPSDEVDAAAMVTCVSWS